MNWYSFIDISFVASVQKCVIRLKVSQDTHIIYIKNMMLCHSKVKLLCMHLRNCKYITRRKLHITYIFIYRYAYTYLGKLFTYR